MKIAPKTAVTVDYTLHLGDGNVVDKSEPGDPLTYLHGEGQIVPGLEKALEGLEPGASKQVVLKPAEGYGERHAGKVQTVPMSAFGGAQMSAGDEFVAMGEDGEPMPVRVVKIDGDQVTIDLNHPLAGETLHFSIQVKDVRQATAEELEHGHAHGADGHHHHDHDHDDHEGHDH